MMSFPPKPHPYPTPFREKESKGGGESSEFHDWTNPQKKIRMVVSFLQYEKRLKNFPSITCFYILALILHQALKKSRKSCLDENPDQISNHMSLKKTLYI